MFIHTHTYSKFLDQKLISISLFMTPVWAAINKYIWSDWEFLRWLALLMTIDTITGIIKSFIRRNAITSGGLRMMTIKFIQYGMFLIVMHILSNFTVDGETVSAYSWMTVPAYTLLMGIEAKSIFENITQMRKDFNLQPFIDRIKETIKLKDNENE